MDELNLYQIIALNIKKQRKLKGWTQVKLAMENNISVDYLKKIETKSGSTKQFSIYTIERIAKALDVNPVLLFESPKELEKVN